jgi:putative phosphoribosyl transferase
VFADRIDAGQQLAEALRPLEGSDPIVLGLPRGGVPVAHEVAVALRAPLDVLVVRKVGLPMQPEVAMGAVGEGGACVRDDELMRRAGVSDEEFVRIELAELAEIERRCRRYRGARAMTDLRGRNVVIVDDGIATGSTAEAAILVAREHGAAHIVLAAPVSSGEAVEALRRIADEVVVVQCPRNMLAVGYWYDDFRPTTDEEVVLLLSRARR